MTPAHTLALHRLASAIMEAGVKVRAAAVLPDGRLKLRVDRCPVAEVWLALGAPLGFAAAPYRNHRVDLIGRAP